MEELKCHKCNKIVNSIFIYYDNDKIICEECLVKELNKKGEMKNEM